jgi:hypothetical protein
MTTIIQHENHILGSRCMSDDPKKKRRDSKTISTQPHELKHAAKKPDTNLNDLTQAKKNPGITKVRKLKKELLKLKKEFKRL